MLVVHGTSTGVLRNTYLLLWSIPCDFSLMLNLTTELKLMKKYRHPSIFTSIIPIIVHYKSVENEHNSSAYFNALVTTMMHQSRRSDEVLAGQDKQGRPRHARGRGGDIHFFC